MLSIFFIQSVSMAGGNRFRLTVGKLLMSCSFVLRHEKTRSRFGSTSIYLEAMKGYSIAMGTQITAPAIW